MGSKSAPRPPDPQETAGAQTANNVGTAVANAYLNNTNQVTPGGALTYSQSGTTAWEDPNTGNTYQIPRFTATTQLSPQQEAIETAGNQAELNLANLASSQSSRLQDLLGQPINYGGIPQRPNLPGLQDYSNFQGFSGLDAGYAQGGPIQYGLGDAGAVRGNFAGGGRVQSNFGSGGGVRSGFGDAGDITRSYAGPDDFGADRLRVEKALMQRMNPYLKRQQDSLQSNLANQGLMMGSEGFGQGMQDYYRSENDARLGAILRAGEEQARLVGMERDRAGFENMAQQQAYGQELGRGQFANQAQQQRFGQALTRSQARNQAQQQRYDQAMGRTAFGNQAQAQRFGQGLAEGQFGNAAQQQAYGQDRMNIDQSNQALQSMYDNYFRATAANNQLQDSRFNQASALYGMQGDARQSALGELYAARNQPINEIASLLSGAQVQMPQFVNTPQYNIPTTDYAGISANNYNQQLAYNQQRNQFGQQLMGGLFGLGAGALSGGMFGGGGGFAPAGGAFGGIY